MTAAPTGPEPRTGAAEGRAEELHQLVVRYCAGEISAEDYFTAIEVRAKSMVEEEVRAMAKRRNR